MAALRNLLLIAAFAYASLVPARAGADAVPPAPKVCPPGKVPETSHAGPRCADKAPTNCPPGWRGYVGGYCAPAVCIDDSGCTEPGHTCRTASLCHEFVTSTDRRGKEHKYWSPVNACAGAEKCATGQCRPAKVCLAAGVNMAAMPRGADGKINNRPPPLPLGSGSGFSCSKSCSRSCSVDSNQSARGGPITLFFLSVLGLAMARRRSRHARRRGLWVGRGPAD